LVCPRRQRLRVKRRRLPGLVQMSRIVAHRAFDPGAQRLGPLRSSRDRGPRGARHRANPPDRPRPWPVTRIVSGNKTAPTWDTRALPSADTSTLLARALFVTDKVPSARDEQGSRQALSRVKGTLSSERMTCASLGRKLKASKGRTMRWSRSTSSQQLAVRSLLPRKSR
jgi:hypothetical protein